MFPLLPCLPCLTGNKGNKYPGDTTGGGSGRGWIRGPVPFYLCCNRPVRQLID